jgi:hypothetical protein
MIRACKYKVRLTRFLKIVKLLSIGVWYEGNQEYDNLTIDCIEVYEKVKDYSLWFEAWKYSSKIL